MILCPELSAPDNGTIVISFTSQVLGVDTTAAYYCNPGYVLAGETTRTCEDASGGTSTVGTWSGITTTCKQIDDLIKLVIVSVKNEKL